MVEEVVAEWFCLWEEHTSVAHGVTLDVVEISVRVGLVVVVETVGSEKSDECAVLYLLFGYVVEIHSGRVALEFHVKSEFLLFHCGGKVVHVFHHQSPVGRSWTVVGVFQAFHKEGFRGILPVGGELAHLVCLSAYRVFECYCEYLVCLESGFQRYISEAAVE